MRYINYLFFIAAIVTVLQSCNNYAVCNKSLLQDFGETALEDWETQTATYIKGSNVKKLTEAIQVQEDKGVSIFDRAHFLQDLQLNKKALGSVKYSSLIIIELNSSGERYRRTKYVFLSCSQQITLLKFYLNQGKWGLVKTRELKKRKLDEAIEILKDRSDSTVYWGDNFNEILALSEFRDSKNIKVELFSTLNRKQYEAIWLLEK